MDQVPLAQLVERWRRGRGTDDAEGAPAPDPVPGS
jgi:hypothetical protein